MLIIINEEDKEEVMQALSEHHFQATMVSTSGAFLQYGNTTYLLGIEDHQLEEVKTIIDENTTIRCDIIQDMPDAKKQNSPGRATAFVIKIREYHQIGG
ncbi:MAG: cyclic-di-AMP receptor [Coprobacillus sp.]